MTAAAKYAEFAATEPRGVSPAYVAMSPIPVAVMPICDGNAEGWPT